jgi:hypothetical protein
MKKSVLLFLCALVIPVLGLTNVADVGAAGMEGHWNVSLGTDIHASVGDEGCNICHDFAGGYYNSPTLGNLFWVREDMDYSSVPSGRTVVFTTSTGPDSLAGGPPYDGPCEVCHTQTDYHRNDGTGPEGSHHDGEDCRICHFHFADELINYFVGIGGDDYPHTIHKTHPRGPRLGEDSCDICHYSNSEFHLFADGNPLFPEPPTYPDGTAICDECHSPGGNDGVLDAALGAKHYWSDPSEIYDVTETELLAGKEDWCLTCHDWEPANSKIAGDGIPAPNVAGDENQLIYGFNVNGHGRPSQAYPDGLNCGGQDGCHQLTRKHIDHDPRTYDASTYPDSNYKAGYRLNRNLDVPRHANLENQFLLCTQCHSDWFGPLSNFRYDKSTEIVYLHQEHLGMYSDDLWDSDSDYIDLGGVPKQYIFNWDSALSCPTCHQPHGAPMDVDGVLKKCPVMIRHGELTGLAPAYNFHWHTQTNGVGPATNVLSESRSGKMRVGLAPYYQGCKNLGCHDNWAFYNRDPMGVATVTVTDISVTDLTLVTPGIAPGDDIRIEVSFTITGSGPFHVKTTTDSKVKQPLVWKIKLSKQEDYPLSAGSYTNYWSWQETIPGTAVAGDAKVAIAIKMKDSPVGTVLGTHSRAEFFPITP